MSTPTPSDRRRVVVTGMGAVDVYKRQVNQGGEAFISHAVLGERLVLRAAVGNIRTRPEDVAALWGALQWAAGLLP